MIFEKVREMLAEKTLNVRRETILPETKFLDIGIDSLDVTEMVMNLEDEFGVEIGMDASIVTVADLVAKIERKLEEKNTAQSSLIRRLLKLHMIKSKICEMLGIEYPIFQGGMAWVADANPCSLFPRAEVLE